MTSSNLERVAGNGANYWPYATTLFDYVRRSMPWSSSKLATDDEVYALTAYILAQNKLIDAKRVTDARTLPKVRMPNRNGFVPLFPERMHPDKSPADFFGPGN